MAMLSFHQENRSVATMAVNNFSYEVPFGVVEVLDRRITGLSEKPQCNFLVNAGIYLFEPEVLDSVPPDEFFDMNSFFDRLIDLDKTIVAFPVREHWLDIGRPDDLERANNTFSALDGGKGSPNSSSVT
jgi:NDP-sugar pyrophosphorylase family protein